MANSGLFGAYALTREKIDEVVRGAGAGAYALGALNPHGVFLISYVGRSDDDLNARLKCHVGNYPQFKYGFYPGAKAAFEKECNLFHDFSPPDNQVHPARPSGTNWTCPRCSALR